MAREQETLLAPALGPSVTHERLRAEGPAGRVELQGPTPSQREPDKYIGTTIDGRYVVEAMLGEGGMGVVYKAQRKVFDRPAALKILRADLAKNSEVLDRFVTEARAASGIGNDHIVDVFDFGEVPDGSTYFAMEYLEGETLGARIAKGRIDPAQVVVLGAQLAEGLAAAHAAQIVHRDLKPDNVFIIEKGGADFIKILDFGIAKVIGIDNKLTRAGAVFGTPHYMSPEQCRGTSVDHRTDIYSLGVILYEMAVGRVPFDAENPLTILSMHLNELPRSFAEAAPALETPPGFENLVLKCLAKKEEERFASMREVELALAAIARGEAVDIDVPISVAPPEPEEPAALFVPRAPASPSLPSDSLAPSSARVPSSDSARHSFPGEVRASMPDAPRMSAASVPSSVDPVEAQLRLAAEAADAERDWARTGKGKTWPIVVGIALVGAIAVTTWGVISMQVETLREAFQPGRSLLFGTSIEPPADPAAAEVPVALVLSPIDARVYLDGRDLGTMPVEVRVKKGKTVEVEVKRDGYWSRKVTLDTDKETVTVRLAPALAGKGAAAKTAPSASPAVEKSAPSAGKAAPPPPGAPAPPAPAPAPNE